MDARATILKKIRQRRMRQASRNASPNKAPDIGKPTAHIEERIRAHDLDTISDIQARINADLVNHFIDKLIASGGGITHLTAMNTLPEACSDYLTERQLPYPLRLCQQPLYGLPWPAHVECRHGRCSPDDKISLSIAANGIAETGTLAFPSHDNFSISSLYLPEVSLVALDAAHIVATLEEVFTELQNQVENTPHSLNLITGPSRTGDIEQTIQIGAHGPHTLHVFLFDNSHDQPA